MGDELVPRPPIEPTRRVGNLNAAKYGVYSVSPAIPWFEEEEDWRALRESFMEDIKPTGAVMAALVDQAAALYWRILRVRRAEREAIATDLANVGRDLRISAIITQMDFPEELTPQKRRQMEQLAMSRLLPSEEAVQRMGRHESRLHRYFLQTLRQIAAMKGWRREGGDQQQL